MWDLPGPEIKPMSPALAGRFLTIGPPGKSLGAAHFKDFDKCIMTHIHHCRIIQNSFNALKMPCVLPIYPSFHQLLATTDLVVSTVLPFPKYQIVGIIRCVAFSDWLLSPSNMHLRLLYVFPWLDTLLFFFFLALNSIPLCGCTTVCLSIHLLKDTFVVSKFWQLWLTMYSTCKKQMYFLALSTENAQKQWLAQWC